MHSGLHTPNSLRGLLPRRGVKHLFRSRPIFLITGMLAPVLPTATFADGGATETTPLFQVGSRASDAGTGYSLFRGPLHGSKDYWIQCSCSSGTLAVKSCPSLSYKCFCADQPAISCNQ